MIHQMKSVRSASPPKPCVLPQPLRRAALVFPETMDGVNPLQSLLKKTGGAPSGVAACFYLGACGVPGCWFSGVISRFQKVKLHKVHTKEHWISAVSCFLRRIFQHMSKIPDAALYRAGEIARW